jgi:hypothetical protein
VFHGFTFLVVITRFVASTIIGHDKSNGSPTLKLFLARSAELVARKAQEATSAGRFGRWADLPHRSCYGPAAMPRTEPSMRKLAGIALIVLLIVLWAGFVASLAPIVGRWPIMVQAPYYLFMGIAWIIPLKPLVRWIESGSFRTRS